MILLPPKRNRSMDDNILPIINIVFLLLIFFVLAGAITRSAPFDLTLPASQQSEDRAVPEDKVLSIAADGRLAFNGETIEPPALRDALADWPADVALQVRADSGLKARRLSTILLQLRAAGIAEVRLLTQHETP